MNKKYYLLIIVNIAFILTPFWTASLKKKEIQNKVNLQVQSFTNNLKAQTLASNPNISEKKMDEVWNPKIEQFAIDISQKEIQKVNESTNILVGLLLFFSLLVWVLIFKIENPHVHKQQKDHGSLTRDYT